MTHPSIHTRDGLPPEMETLLRDYPRAAWPGHTDFEQSIRNWMGAHAGFRHLARIVSAETDKFLDREMGTDTYAERLGFFGNRLVQNLHGHHTWEDRSFFPELRAADPRFTDGLDTLEADHLVLDETIDRLTRRANRVIKLARLDETQARSEAGGVLEAAHEIERFLDRHLTDEEDLVYPILLHHKLRG